MFKADYCSKCGHKLSANDAFCPRCGTSTNPSSSSPTTVVPNRPTARTPQTPTGHRFAGSDIARIIAALIAALALIIAALVGGPKLLILLNPPASPTSLPTNPTVALTTPQTTKAKETLTFPLTSGSNGATTTQSYQGPTTLKVSGTGQAAGTQFSDAFYIYTNSDGTPNKNPLHFKDFLSLCINGQPVDRFVQAIPAYRSDHTYTFIINAPGGLLTFGICDNGVNDNTSSFTVMIF